METQIKNLLLTKIDELETALVKLHKTTETEDALEHVAGVCGAVDSTFTIFYHVHFNDINTAKYCLKEMRCTYKSTEEGDAIQEMQKILNR